MTTKTAREKAEEFLAASGEFRLGDLVTESDHPVTKELSQTAEKSVPDALRLLFKVDEDVLSTYKKWAATDAPSRMRDSVVSSIKSGGKVFFTGCGATGRLSRLLEAIWREFWEKRDSPYKDRSISIMSGGDYALIKSVEGFEDFTRFGEKQIEDMGVESKDTVFAITEGGETSFVIGTAWAGVKCGAKVYFVYDNPDDVLREHVERSREVIDSPQIQKINLTTGPMAIMGSTRMQATSIQLCAMLTVLEMAFSDLSGEGNSAIVPEEFACGLDIMYKSLLSDEVINVLSELVELEAEAYRGGHKSTYFANHLGIDVLTDTTERSPTFCTPAFRKWDDEAASESWAYLILPQKKSKEAWDALLRRSPRCLSWSEEEIYNLAGKEDAPRQIEIMRQIGPEEILKFRIGTDGLGHRKIESGDMAVGIVSDGDPTHIREEFFKLQMEHAKSAGASTAVVFTGHEKTISKARSAISSWVSAPSAVYLPVPQTGLLLDGIQRVGIKMLLNALSTCIMVRLGRVRGNCMVAVVASNLKLIDRSARYIQTLTNLPYDDACRLLFEAIEYVKPRMDAAKSYPPTVELSVIKFSRGCTFAEAEDEITSRKATCAGKS